MSTGLGRVGRLDIWRGLKPPGTPTLAWWTELGGILWGSDTPTTADLFGTATGLMGLMLTPLAAPLVAAAVVTHRVEERLASVVGCWLDTMLTMTELVEVWVSRCGGVTPAAVTSTAGLMATDDVLDTATADSCVAVDGATVTMDTADWPLEVATAVEDETTGLPPFRPTK